MKRLIKFILFTVLILTVVYSGLLYLFPKEHEALAEKYSAEFSVDKSLVYAVMKAESNFSADAVSHAGANGLMQITDETAVWISEKLGYTAFDVNTLSEPEINIKFGVWYLSYLIKELNSVDLAILSYNAGITNVKKWMEENIINSETIEIENIPYQETKIYLTKVKLYRKIYEILYK